MKQLRERGSVWPVLIVVQGAVGTRGGRWYTPRGLGFTDHRAGVRRRGEECVGDGMKELSRGLI